MLSLCWTILGLPLAAAATIFFVLIPAEHRAADKSKLRLISAGISCLSIAAAFLLTCLLYLTHRTEILSSPGLESSLTWITAPQVRLEIGILLNGLTLLMLLIVNGVAGLVACFSARYMQGEEGYSRYFAALSFFTFSMLGIVLANNLIQIFIFWELVGLSSYLLIGFWFEKPSAAMASKKAFLTTRVGDVGMMLGILLLFGLLLQNGKGTFNFIEIRSSLSLAIAQPHLFTLACLGLFMGAVGKSAQVPLHVWLPDAMEGPTPASALIHAATMVAAGVFMIARLLFIFEMSPAVMHTIAWTGVITAFIAASIAVVQNDIKKVLAYSTLSQLGYMVMALGLGNSEAGMFHLTTHAFFKALLFLAAGSLIHALHTQDIWEMSARIRQSKKDWFKNIPVTGLTFLIGTAALAGIPFTSGFFSKEEILGAASTGPGLLFGAALLVVFLTAFYMGRVITVVFFSVAAEKNSLEKTSGHEPHEDNWFITAPLLILAVLALIAGYLPLKDFLHESVLPSENQHPGWLAGVSIAFSLAGLFLGFILYRKKNEEKHFSLFLNLVRVLKEKYFFDRFYDWLIANVQENIAKAAALFDQYVIVRAGEGGAAGLTQKLGSAARRLQNGWIQSYGLFFVLGLTVLIAFIVFHGVRL